VLLGHFAYVTDWKVNNAAGKSLEEQGEEERKIRARKGEGGEREGYAETHLGVSMESLVGVVAVHEVLLDGRSVQWLAGFCHTADQPQRQNPHSGDESE